MAVSTDNLVTLAKNSDGDDPWDDTLLIAAYDEASERVAAALASQSLEGPIVDSKEKYRPGQFMLGNSKVTNNKPLRWKVGSYCRCVYTADSLEYEAQIRTIDGDSCTVQYVGYNNEEQHKLSNLMASLGGKTRKLQEEEARATLVEANVVEETNGDVSEKVTSSAATKRNVNLAPPPPPLFKSAPGAIDDDEALSSMLMSWYMSGYHTGYYKAMQDVKSKQSTNATE
ncbi:Survival motor neuron protein [Halotydeus destructor]|nr:Survival motor neuron protein [Halotydeus destructor]